MKLNQIKTGAMLSYIAIFSSMAISLIYTPYMVNVLGKSEFGLYSLVNTIISYFTILDFGFGNAIVRYTSKYKNEANIDRERSISGLFLIFYLIIAIISFLLGLILITNIDNIFKFSMTTNELIIMRRLLWLAIFNISISFPLSLFSSVVQANQKFVMLNLLRLIRTLVNPLFMIGVLYMGYGSFGMIASITILNIIFNIYHVYYCYAKLDFKITFNKLDTILIKEILTYSSFIFVGILVDRFFWSTDQILLGIMTNSGEVAVYSIASTFTRIFISLSSVIGGMYLPHFIKLISENPLDDKIISDEFTKISRFQFLISIYVFLGFILVGKEFISLWVGIEYADSYYIAALVMFGLVVSVSQNAGIAVIQAKNMIKFRSYMQFIIAIINVILTIILIPRFGGIGAAFATFISFFFGIGIIMSIYYHKYVKLDIISLWKTVIYKLPIYFAIYAVVLFVKNQIIMKSYNYSFILIISLIYTVLFMLATYFVFLNDNEKKIFQTKNQKIQK